MSPFVLNVIGTGAEPEPFAPLGLGKATILSPSHAFDLPVADRSALLAAREIAGAAPFDINLLPAANRRKKLLLADMDSTIISVECLDELAEIAGLRPKMAAITERAMRGEIEFEGALKERVALLKSLPLAALARVHAERVRLNPGARSLIATMRKAGARTMLVSSGFRFFTRRVAAEAGFDAEQGNTLIDDGTFLTGTIAEPIFGCDAKLKALEAAVAELHLGYEKTLAVGDGANDLAMIKRAGLGVAYHARPVAAEAADASIAHGDLIALLYLQGYRDEEIVDAWS